MFEGTWGSDYRIEVKWLWWQAYFGIRPKRKISGSARQIRAGVETHMNLNKGEMYNMNWGEITKGTAQRISYENT